MTRRVSMEGNRKRTGFFTSMGGEMGVGRWGGGGLGSDGCWRLRGLPIVRTGLHKQILFAIGIQMLRRTLQGVVGGTTKPEPKSGSLESNSAVGLEECGLF